MAIPRLTVMNRVGTRTSNATPTQKSENSAAVTRERRTVPIVNEAKMRMGVAESRTWMARKVARMGCSLAKLDTLL